MVCFTTFCFNANENFNVVESTFEGENDRVQKSVHTWKCENLIWGGERETNWS